MANAVLIQPEFFPSGAGVPTTAGDLARAASALDVGTPNDAVMDFWTQHPGQDSAAVVKDGRPVGLLNRHVFMEAWARPFQRELFGRRSCDTWMNHDPLIIDAQLSLQTLAARAIEAGSKFLENGFVVVRDGRYLGIGTGMALLEATSAAEAARARQIRDSIEYASLIQRSQLEVSARQLAKACPDHQLIWEPRDVVGGDCYFFRIRGDVLVGAVVDCTGHGVPGAFMTVIALSVLERAVEESGTAAPDPGRMLSALNAGLKRALGQRFAEADRSTRSDDGLDAACFVLPATGGALTWAGAKIPLMVASEGRVDVFEPSRRSVGYRDTPDDHRWDSQRIQLPRRGVVALVTDGISDQTGGPRKIGFGRKRIGEVLADHSRGGARSAAEALRRALLEWQGPEPRRDDVTALLFGMNVSHELR